MLDSGWFEPDVQVYLVTNVATKAARDFGVTDDRVRRQLLVAGPDGKKVWRWQVAAGVAAKEARINQSKLLARAKSKEIAARVKQTSIIQRPESTQRPTFLFKTRSATARFSRGRVR